MKRGDVWLAQVGRKSRPVVVLTRTGVIDVRALVTVAEITTSVRGIGAEVRIDGEAIDLDRRSAVNCDGLHTVPRTMLTTRLGNVGGAKLTEICTAVGYALGCSV